MPICIFDYKDYREFIKNRFEEIRKKNPSFSFRSFNRLAGLKSSGFLKLVIQGKRNLAENGILKIAKGFRLDEDELRYFRFLTLHNQEKVPEVRILFTKKIKSEILKYRRKNKLTNK